jgi:hypothetical protein
LTVVTLNAAGLFQPPAARRRARQIARLLDPLALDIFNAQEIHTYGLFRILAGSLPSLQYASWKPGLAGPRGGLVTFSRHPVGHTSFHSSAPTVRRLGALAPKRALLDSLHKGVLITEFAPLPTVVLNAHFVADTDGDWSPEGRFAPTHKAILADLRELADSRRWHGRDLVVTGDFNVARSSGLYSEFIRQTGWVDAFSGTQEPTFRPEYLPAGARLECVDYLLAQGECRPENASLIFEDEVALGVGRSIHLSDHLGLKATLVFSRQA